MSAEAAFQKVWDLQQTHDIAANLGDCELQVGQAREAAEHLAFAVSTFPMTGNDAVLKRSVERFEEAKREVATVRVTVNVDGATILAGGRRVGQSPLLREGVDRPARDAGWPRSAFAPRAGRGGRALAATHYGDQAGIITGQGINFRGKMSATEHVGPPAAPRARVESVAGGRHDLRATDQHAQRRARRRPTRRAQPLGRRAPAALGVHHLDRAAGR
jgi:hypothetical protein